MALVTAGITASWSTTGSTALGEVTEIKWIKGGGLPQSRGSTTANAKPWSLDLGSVEVSFLAATAATLMDQWGLKGTLSIGGSVKNTKTAAASVVSLTTKAIVQTLDLGAKVNDVCRYKGTFKLVQE